VIHLFERAHNNYAKFHYNHHRVQLITWSLATCSLSSLREFSILNCSFDDIVHHLFHWSLGHLVTWSLATWSLGDKPFWACTLQLCKTHYNHHRVQLITWSLGYLVTWSLGHLVTWSLSHLENFPFKIVASILFIIFFTGHLIIWSLDHLVTWSLGHLVTWSLSHLVINFYGRAHNNYAKFHYNRISSLWTHRGQTNKQTNLSYI
jgi:hypothetical protein